MYVCSACCLMAQSEVSLSYLLNFGPQDARFQVASAPERGELFIAFPAIGRLSMSFFNAFSSREFNAATNPRDLLNNHQALGLDFIQDNILIGYKDHKNRYFAFSSSHVVEVDFRYPKGLIGLLWEGNSSLLNARLDVDFPALDLLAYREFAFTYSAPVARFWRIGGRVRYLNGLFRAITPEQGSLSFELDPNFFSARGIFVGSELRLAGTTLLEPTNEVGHYIQNNNHGAAIDLGFSYEPSALWKIEASIRDIGAIQWKDKARIHASRRDTIVFEGVDLKDSFKKEANILGLLDGGLSLTDSVASFISPLHPNITMRGSYYFAKNQQLVASTIVRRFGEAEFGRYRFTIGVAYVYHFLPNFTFSGSVTRYPQNNFGIGLGLAYNVGSFQFYLTGGNVLAVNVPTAKALDFNFGINIVTGRNWGRKYLCP